MRINFCFKQISGEKFGRIFDKNQINHAVNFPAAKQKAESGKIKKLRAFEDAITGIGYGVSKNEITLKISGMHCTSCALDVETALKKTNGVTFATVNFPLEQAKITFATIVMLFPGRQFFEGTYKGLKQGVTDMNLLT